MRTIKAIISVHDDYYTISELDMGGAIVSGKDLEETKKQFEHMTSVASSVKTLVDFHKTREYVKADYKVEYLTVNLS